MKPAFISVWPVFAKDKIIVSAPVSDEVIIVHTCDKLTVYQEKNGFTRYYQIYEQPS